MPRYLISLTQGKLEPHEVVILLYVAVQRDPIRIQHDFSEFMVKYRGSFE